MNIENTIKNDIQNTGIKKKLYAQYLGISPQAIHKRLQRKETREERDGFEAFLKFRGINLIKEANDIKE